MMQLCECYKLKDKISTIFLTAISADSLSTGFRNLNIEKIRKWVPRMRLNNNVQLAKAIVIKHAKNTLHYEMCI